VSRSTERQAEIRAQDAIERAMAKAEALGEPGRARVFQWARETYFPDQPGGLLGDGASAASGSYPVKDEP
jgi:hypothetical protein